MGDNVLVKGSMHRSKIVQTAAMQACARCISQSSSALLATLQLALADEQPWLARPGKVSCRLMLARLGGAMLSTMCTGT